MQGSQFSAWFVFEKEGFDIVSNEVSVINQSSQTISRSVNQSVSQSVSHMIPCWDARKGRCEDENYKDFDNFAGPHFLLHTTTFTTLIHFQMGSPPRVLFHPITQLFLSQITSHHYVYLHTTLLNYTNPIQFIPLPLQLHTSINNRTHWPSVSLCRPEWTIHTQITATFHSHFNTRLKLK